MQSFQFRILIVLMVYNIGMLHGADTRYKKGKSCFRVVAALRSDFSSHTWGDPYLQHLPCESIIKIFAHATSATQRTLRQVNTYWRESIVFYWTETHPLNLSFDRTAQYINKDAQMLCDLMAQGTLTVRTFKIKKQSEEGFKNLLGIIAKNLNIVSFKGQFGKGIVAVLSQELKNNTTVRQLDLSGIALQDTDCVFLAKALEKNEVLKRIDLSNTQIGDKGVRNFIQVLLKNRTLTYLDLSGNTIMVESILYLRNAMKNNTTMLTLCLSLHNASWPEQYHYNELKNYICNKDKRIKLLD